MLVFETNPVESICAWIIDLLYQEFKEKLVEILGTEHLLSFGGFQQRIGKAFADLFLHMLLIDQNYLIIVDFD